MLQNNGGIVTAKTRIFEERYSGGVLDMNVFCFAFIDENDGNGSIVRDGSTISSQVPLGISAIKKDIQGQIPHEKEILVDDVIEEKFEEDGGSHSATGSSSSAGTSTTSMTEFRNFHSFTE